MLCLKKARDQNLPILPQRSFDMEGSIRNDIKNNPDEYLPLKSFIVQYVGAKMSKTKTDDSVTVEMIIEVLANEFPELVLCLAEENFLRGYEQAFQDLDVK